MKSTSALSILLFLAGTEALPRGSAHVSLLERNFRNVAGDGNAALARREPQGPASNPGEFAGPDLSIAIADNFVPEMGDSGDSESQSATITASATLSSGTPESSSSINWQSNSYGDSGPLFESAFGLNDGPSTTQLSTSVGGGHHHRSRSGVPGPTAYYPHPTGHHPHPTGHHRPTPTGHHRHHNGTGRWHHGDHEHHGPYVGEAIVETEVERDGDVLTVHETLWQFNGTGWNRTDIPLPSGTATGLLPPPPPISESVSTGTGMPIGLLLPEGPVGIDNGFNGGTGQSSSSDARRPGFVGPKDEKKPKSDGGLIFMQGMTGWLSGII